ncbi:MAG: thiamine pyrophosphate-binding protein [Pseudomonadota bacterium]
MSDTNQNNESTGAEAMVRMLAAHDVKTIFGLCGDTSLPFYDALYRLNHGMSHILTRDERSAAYMADGYARVTGKVGVCEGPSGGGATYILPGIVEASESSVPVLAITTDVATTSAGRFPLTELDQEALFRPLTTYNAMIRSGGELPRRVRAAFKAMTVAPQGAAHLGLPFDVQKQAVPEDEIWADPQFGSFPALPTVADTATLKAATDTLLSARSPLIICGGGVVLSRAETALQLIVDLIDIPVATTVSGQGAIPETHPCAVGVVGSNGGVESTRSIVDESDLILFIGCRAGSVTTERWRAPARGVRIVHIDNDPAVLGTNYPTEVAVLSDARLALEAIAADIELRDPDAPKFTGAARAARAREAKAHRLAPLAASNDRPIRPERVIAALNALLPNDAIVIADPGTPCPYFSAYFTLRQPGRQFFSNRAHGALGYALGASVGAQVGRPNAKVICAMGDGSFGFAVGELETVTRLGLPITFLVFSNSVYGWIKAGQRAGFGERYFSVDFSRTDHAAVASAYGLKTWRVDDPSRLEEALKAAIATDGPTLVDIIAQPLNEAAAPVSEWIA